MYKLTILYIVLTSYVINEFGKYMFVWIFILNEKKVKSLFELISVFEFRQILSFT